jgi:hypothetical protein
VHPAFKDWEDKPRAGDQYEFGVRDGGLPYGSIPIVLFDVVLDRLDPDVPVVLFRYEGQRGGGLGILPDKFAMLIGRGQTPRLSRGPVERLVRENILGWSWRLA